MFVRLKCFHADFNCVLLTIAHNPNIEIIRGKKSLFGVNCFVDILVKDNVELNKILFSINQAASFGVYPIEKIKKEI